MPMQVPLQITIRDIPHTKEIEDHIRERAQKLDQFCSGIISCRITIEQVKKHPHQGKLYNALIYISLPNKELVTGHNEDENTTTSLRKAFEDIEIQLEEHNQRIHGKVKTHAQVLQGKVVRLFKGDDFGFIEGLDGTEYYFNADHTLNGHFDHLKVGSEVRFIEHTSHDGLQAHRVSPHHLPE